MEEGLKLCPASIGTKTELKNSQIQGGVCQFLSGILQSPMVVVLSSSLYLHLSHTEALFLQSHTSNKIMSAHVVDKNWMRAVDEKQVISL